MTPPNHARGATPPARPTPAGAAPPCRTRPRGLARLLVLALLAAGPVQAERADRTKPMVVEADRNAVVDYQRQTLVYTGNVLITQGTMTLRAERVELRETPDGYRAAIATGSAARPATWRQRRDGPVDEYIEGSADRIEFDGKTDTLRLVGNGVVRRTRSGAVVDDVSGSLIVWDNIGEIFRVEGGTATAANPSGRVRTVLSPRVDPASAPAASPGGNGARR